MAIVHFSLLLIKWVCIIAAKVITNAGYEALDLVLRPVKNLGVRYGTLDNKNILDWLIFSHGMNAWDETAHMESRGQNREGRCGGMRLLDRVPNQTN
jgi:hypothetical protein